jgi:uncharacterized protein YukJ
MGTEFSAINAVQINNYQKENMLNSKKMATLPHISQFPEDHLKDLAIENYSQNQMTFDAL